MKELSSFVWLNAQKHTDGAFHYNNDTENSVHAEQLFVDETSKYLHGDCVAIQPHSNEISKFYLQAVNCTTSAQVVCKVNVTIPPPPGENLPKLPCVQTASRKKRSAQPEQCTDSTGNNCIETTPDNGIYKSKYYNLRNL